MASIASILQEVRGWSEAQRLELLVQLAVLVKEQHVRPELEPKGTAPSVFDLAAEYAGIFEGPSDLSINKHYLEDLGAS